MFGPVASAPVASLGESLIFQEYYVVPLAVTFGSGLSPAVFLATYTTILVTTAQDYAFETTIHFLLINSVAIQQTVDAASGLSQSSLFVVYVSQGR